MSEKRYTRRRFIHEIVLPAATAAAATGLFSTISCGKGPYSTDMEKPNIVLITADDLGWRDLSCYGNTNIETPRLDSLARQGVRFTNAFVVASSCAPSRASLITGQYPHTNGVTGLTHIYKTRSLSPFHFTLPKLLRDAGYNTALQGKWHPSPYLPTSWYGYNERLSGVLPKDWYIKDEKRAVDFIARNKNNRFYLELNFMQNHRDKHGEFTMDPDFPVDANAVRVPEYMTLPDLPELREDLAKFYSQTKKMDHLVGKILDFLDDNGLSENTLVVFMSDNGPPYPGNKITLYDRGTGVPLILRWPAKLRAGRTIAHLVNTIDIMPSILEAAGIPIPVAVQGRSLLPMARADRPGPLHEAVFMEMTDHVLHTPTRAVRTNGWKYIRNYSDIAIGLDQNNHMEWAHRICELPGQPWKKPRPREELYDLAADPNERRNLAEDSRYARRLEEMRTLLDEHMRSTGDPYRGREFASDFDPELYRPYPPGHIYK